MWFTRVSIKNPIFAVMVMLALIVLGMMGYNRMPVDQTPEVEFPIVVVQTTYDGAAPTSVENDVSRPVEEALNTVGGIKTLTSRSYQGLSVVTAEFELGTNMNKAMQDVRGKMDTLKRSLRDEVDTPVVSQVDPTAVAMMTLVISGDSQRSLRDLTDMADNTIVPKIQTARGVGDVTILGGVKRQVNIILDANQMESLGVTAAQVASAIKANNQELPAGTIDNNEKQIIVQVKGRITDIQGFRRIVVANRGGQPVYLEQIATVEDGIKEKTSASLVNGEPTLGLSIIKSSGTNTIEVADNVRTALAELQKSLPADIKITARTDQSKTIKAAVDDVRNTIFEGAILTIMIVFLFLHSWRSTVITALTLPVAMIGTFGFIYLMGFTINTMTLMALSLSVGLLIDDAIVVRENIVRHVQMGSDHYTASLEATKEIGLAVLATTLSIVAVFLPLGFMKGIIGQFFHPFSLTVVVAVLLSMFVSFTLDPMLSSAWYDPDAHKPLEKKRGAKLLVWFEGHVEDFSLFYQRMLRWALKHRVKTLLIAFMTFAISLPIVKVIGSEFLPQTDQSEMNVRFKTPVGTTLEQTTDKVKQVQAVLKAEFPDIDYSFARIGGGTSGSNVANIYVKLKPLSKRSHSLDEMKILVRQRLVQIGGINISKVSGQEGGPAGANKQLIFNIKGPDLNRLEAYSAEALAKLKSVPGTVDLESTVAEKKPSMDLKIDTQRAADLGLNTSSLATTVSGLVTGTSAGVWRAPNDEDYSIELRLKESQRTRPEDIANLRIATAGTNSNGQPILARVGDVAQVVQGSTSNEIVRENLVRRIQIDANPAGRSVGEVSADMDAVLKDMKWEPGYSYEAAGDSKDQAESMGYAMTALGLGIIFIYMVLASQFNSLLQPIAIMSTLPLSLIGVFSALLLFKSSLNMFSVVGFVLLMGLVTKNAILLIDFINQARASGSTREEAILDAVKIRLRPILMTTLAMVFGMLPMAMALGEGSEQRAPMGQAVIGGTITSTLLTLVVVPVVYTYLDDWGARAKRFFAKSGTSEQQPH
ncbi:efflux RND transporter permease subunit [Hydromonas duriensis]|uniref:HAE1 family hydrophobic/amphiphilic exporter-1 n=1 Tax=Hydromonas duriensis TaxID=1527608 RepID=A0A4R6Y7T8_9BURK|nr:efflux RND transporter permease subunit [Hydromonas duriensis]TDR31434.1 HAE1 family hydrophobic/amphiphilic exporter-1 [Hydromonas duriensis]